MPPPPPMQMMLETSTRGEGGGGTEQAETPHGVVDPTFMAGTAGAAPTATANSDDMAELSKLFVLYNHDLDRVQKHLEGNLDRVQKHLEGSRNANAEVRPLVPILYRTRGLWFAYSSPHCVSQPHDGSKSSNFCILLFFCVHFF